MHLGSYITVIYCVILDIIFERIPRHSIVKLEGGTHITIGFNILEPKGTVVVLPGAIPLILFYYVH